MTNLHPPRWAESLLRLLLRPADRETIPGDLLEEYRAAKVPQLGRFRANVWYVTQVASFLMPLVWPFAVGVVVMTFGGFFAEPWFRIGYGSPIPAPGVSPLHAVLYACAGYYGARRTGLVRTGMLLGGMTALIAVVALLALMASMPGFVFPNKPSILIVVYVFFWIAATYGGLIGALAGVAGRAASPPSTRVSALTDGKALSPRKDSKS